MSIPKPKMRGLLEANIKRNIAGMVITCGALGVLFKVFYVDRRKALYANFYKTYDADAVLKRMIDAGYMQSAPK